jgi:hypothetical protein
MGRYYFCEDEKQVKLLWIRSLRLLLLTGVKLSGCALITSGRQPGVMVAKATKAGFLVLVSESVPLNSGVELSENDWNDPYPFARRPNL